MNKPLNIKLTLSIVLLAAVMVLRDLFGLGINQVLILGLIGIAAVILPYNELFCFTSFVAPVACGINGYAITILLLALYAKSKRKIISQFLPAIVLIFVELLHSSIYAFSFSREFLYFSNIALFFFCSNDTNDVDPQKVVKSFIYGTALCCLLIIGRTYIINGSFSAIFLDNARIGSVMGENEMETKGLTHMVLNANSLAYISLLGTTCLLFGRKVLNLGKIPYYSLLILLLLGGAITVGRTWLLVLCAILLLYVFSSSVKRKIGFVFFILTGLVVVAQTEMLNSLFSVITESFSVRFSSNLMQAGGRTDLWNEYMQIWISDISYIICGISAPNYRLLFPNINAIHNIIQQIFVCTGIIGLSVYVIFGVNIIRNSLRANTKFLFYLPLIAAFVYLQSIPVLADWILILPVFPCIYALKIK